MLHFLGTGPPLGCHRGVAPGRGSWLSARMPAKEGEPELILHVLRNDFVGECARTSAHGLFQVRWVIVVGMVISRVLWVPGARSLEFLLGEYFFEVFVG